jgi:hypothetical protein
VTVTGLVADRDWKLDSQRPRLGCVPPLILATVLLIAPTGDFPVFRGIVERLKGTKLENGKYFLGFKRKLNDERSHRKYFVVQFKNGGLRGVTPDPHDPLRFHEQIVQSDDGLHWQSQDGSDTLLISKIQQSKMDRAGSAKTTNKADPGRFVKKQTFVRMISWGEDE